MRAADRGEFDIFGGRRRPFPKMPARLGDDPLANYRPQRVSGPFIFYSAYLEIIFILGFSNLTNYRAVGLFVTPSRYV